MYENNILFESQLIIMAERTVFGFIAFIDKKQKQNRTEKEQSFSNGLKISHTPCIMNMYSMLVHFSDANKKSLAFANICEEWNDKEQNRIRTSTCTYYESNIVLMHSCLCEFCQEHISHSLQ